MTSLPTRDDPLTWRVITAVIAAVAGVSGSFAYSGLTPSFIGEPASTFVVDAMPASIVNPVLDTLGAYAHPASFAIALALITGVLAVVVGLALQLEDTIGYEYLSVPVTWLGIWFVAGGTTGNWTAALAAAVPATAVVAIIEYATENDSLSVRGGRTPDRSKRTTLQAGFGVLSMAGLSALIGQRRTPSSDVPYLGGGTNAPLGEQTLLSDARGASFELDNAPGLVSEIGNFYTIDINSIKPLVDRDEWDLSITGAVNEEQTLDYEALRDRESEHFFSTLRCVGEDLNDREMDNAVWTGVPVSSLLEDAEPQAEYAVIHAVDDYWNTIDIEELERSYLVYGMNGRVLPRDHGNPVRLLVPGNWGEVNIKWIDEIEIVDEDVDGYWHERGWEGTGEVKTVSKIWSVDRDGDEVTVGGHAYAGLPGIDAVEVSTDGGDSWTEAELSMEPTPAAAGRDVWRQWRHTFTLSQDSHEVVVRAIDGNGNLQTEEPSGSRPDGATGWVSQTINR